MSQMATTDSEDLERPYSPSWVDRINAGIDRAPIPVWLSYSGVFIVLALISHSTSWLDGSVPFGGTSPDVASIPVWMTLALVFIHYTDGVSIKALETFRGVLGASDSKFRALCYQISTMPSRPTLLLTLIAPLIGILAFATSWAPLGSGSGSIVGLWIQFSLGWLFFPILIYHTVRHLRLVGRIHELATHIDLFDLDPLYAFSGLTVRTAVGWIVIVNLNIAQNAVLQSESSLTPGTVAWVVITSVQLFLVTLTFILPLWGIHRRLDKEKARWVLDANRRMKASIELLNRRVDAEEVDHSTGLYHTLSSLEIERRVLDGIPTWPWRPATLRGFLAAITLPTIVWLAQELLNRLLDF